MTQNVINKYFSSSSLVKHQLDSFNHFVYYGIQKVIDDVGDISCENNNAECHIKFGKISLSTITHTETDGQTKELTPHDARLRNITYASTLYINIEVINGIETHSFPKCELGKIPIMVGSEYCMLRSHHDERECHHDPKGYFIVSGSEKVMISQEKMNNNQVYIFERNNSKVEMEAELRSIEENDVKSSTTIKVYVLKVSEGEYRLMASFPFLKTDVPALLIFSILGKNYENFIKSHNNDVLYYSKLHLNMEVDDNPREYFMKKVSMKEDSIEEILNKYFLLHVQTSQRKLFMYGYMLNKLVETFAGDELQDDRDHFKNKRVDLPGELLTSLFRQLYKKTHKEMAVAAQKAFEQSGTININNILKTKIITNGLKYALATGNWGIGPSQNVRNGVSQVLNRHSYLSTLSHLRRINSPIGKDGKLTAPRQLHGSHAYRICPCETPEGQSCGLVKNIALTCVISTGVSSQQIKKMLFEYDVVDIENCEKIQDDCKIFVNGYFLGYHCDSSSIIDFLKAKKRNCDISPETGIAYDDARNEIRIHTDGGRCCRPVFIVDYETQQILYDENTMNECTFEELLLKGVVEFLDSDEEECALIAFSTADLQERSQKGLKFTHCELHASMMMGICAAMIPYSNHNQAPRNVYQSAMCKQAMGQYCTNHEGRFDSYGHVLWYPQKPLVKTATHDTFQFDEMPSGINAIVAIACYGGYNQEDSLIMNQSSIDKGMFRSYFYRTYKDETKQHGSNSKDVIEKPNSENCIGMKYANYDKIDIDGLAQPGEFLHEEDIVIGKTTVLPNIGENSEKTKKDYSTLIRHNEAGQVDKVLITANEQGQTMAKVKMRSMRVPEVGDKFSSRHGQKGTVGITLRNEDMPFTDDGIVPDVIVNPHAIPSRMTVAQLIECISGKTSAIDGKRKDATAFDHDSSDDIAEQLHRVGFHRYGTEKMHCGYTGEYLDADIFIGPTYYQRLKHMVNDKVHGRAKGPVQILTRQPVEGRSRGGGLRFGEMERDCIISHGGAAFLKERLIDQSDAFVTCVCKQCGFMAINDAQRNIKTCTVCKSSEYCVDITIPYACKLLFQELMSMNIAVKIEVE